MLVSVPSSVARVGLGKLGSLQIGQVIFPIALTVQIRLPASTRRTFTNLLILTVQTAGDEMPPVPIRREAELDARC